MGTKKQRSNKRSINTKGAKTEIKWAMVTSCFKGLKRDMLDRTKSTKAWNEETQLSTSQTKTCRMSDNRIKQKQN